MDTLYRSLNDFFSARLESLECDEKTRAYIVSVLAKYKTASNDYSKDSLTSLYAAARFRQDFLMYDQLGSWIFYCETFFPEHLNSASKSYYYDIGMLSYDACFKLINRKWLLYQELAHNFVHLSNSTRELILECQTPADTTLISLD